MTTGNIYRVLTVYSILFEDFTGVYSVFTSAVWDGHYDSYFTDEETEARFAHWPRVTGQGHGGAPIRFRAAWLQSHSLIHTRWARDTCCRGHLVGKGGCWSRQGKSGRWGFRGIFKRPSVQVRAFGLHGKKAMEKQWVNCTGALCGHPAPWENGSHSEWWVCCRATTLAWVLWLQGFPCGSDGKESACRVGGPGSIPGLGRSPGEGKGYPL